MIYNNYKKNNMNDFQKIPSILPASYLKSSLSELYNSGLPRGLETSIDALDNVFRLDRGRLVTVTGVPNCGKSEFVDFLATVYNKRYGMKTLYFSPENQPVSLHLSKLVSKFTNKPFEKENMADGEVEAIMNHICDNFFFFNYEKTTTLRQILDGATELIRTKGIDSLVIDAYNKIESEKQAGEIETEFISKILDELCRFAIKNNIILFLVAHPRKMEWNDRNGSPKCPNAYDINGSANFFNKSDYVLAVHRERGDSNEVTIKVDKVKFKNYGESGVCKLRYDYKSGNYYGEMYDDDFYHDDSEMEYTPIEFTLPQLSAKREPLDVEVSLYSGATDNTGTTVNLKEFLLSDAYKGVVETIRSGKTPEERHRIKDEQKGRIPAVTVSGLFSQRGSKNIVSPSGLISVDIDLKDNKDIMSCVPDILRKLDYVAYFGKSISGDGYFAVIPIENPNHFKEHYCALEQEMKSYGITLDKSCKDIGRLRFASYDADGYYNPDATTYYWEVDTTQPPKVSKPKYTATSTMSDAEKVEQQISMLKQEGLSIPDDYDTWFKVGMSLSSTFGEDGRRYFHELSSTSPKYDRHECNRQYDEIVSHYESDNQYTLGTLYHIIKEARDGSSMA